jgi:hypothetical protein
MSRPTLRNLRTAQRQLAVDNSQEVLRPLARSADDLTVGIG